MIKGYSKTAGSKNIECQGTQLGSMSIALLNKAKSNQETTL